MKNQLDGGEAVLQAFRSLGIDYIMSSPGSEWGSVWEARRAPGSWCMVCARALRRSSGSGSVAPRWAVLSLG